MSDELDTIVAADNDKYMIRCENLVKIYKTSDVEVVALQGLDLDVERGELMAIVGNSGSGKSTLLNMLGGLDKPSAGNLYVDGKDLLKFTDKDYMEYKRNTVGFVWQNNARNLVPYLTAIGELIARYICTVEFLAKKYGTEVHEDLVQEGLMGLLGAVRTYREDKNAKFSTYATKCIKNKIISSVHRNALLSGGEEADLEAILGGGGTVPEEVVVEREELNELYDKITSALSEQEWQVFQSFLRGMSYNQIALGLGTSEKAVDNAMQRVRRKLRSLLR